VTTKCCSKVSRLHRVRMDGEKMIAQQGVLFLTDAVSVHYVLPALRARHNEHGRR